MIYVETAGLGCPGERNSPFAARYRRLRRKEKTPAIERPGRGRNQVDLAFRWCVRVTFALTAAAAHGGLVALGLAAAFALGAALGICATAALLAFLHGGFHVLALATRLTIFHFTLVFAATGCGVLGIDRGVMAATFAVFHVGHIVMATPLGLRGRRRVRYGRGCRRLLRPANQ